MRRTKYSVDDAEYRSSRHSRSMRSSSKSRRRSHDSDNRVHLYQSKRNYRPRSPYEEKNSSREKYNYCFPAYKQYRYLPLGPTHTKAEWLQFEDWLHRRQEYRRNQHFDVHKIWQKSCSSDNFYGSDDDSTSESLINHEPETARNVSGKKFRRSSPGKESSNSSLSESDDESSDAGSNSFSQKNRKVKNGYSNQRRSRMKHNHHKNDKSEESNDDSDSDETSDETSDEASDLSSARSFSKVKKDVSKEHRRKENEKDKKTYRHKRASPSSSVETSNSRLTVVNTLKDINETSLSEEDEEKSLDSKETSTNTNTNNQVHTVSVDINKTARIDNSKELITCFHDNDNDDDDDDLPGPRPVEVSQILSKQMLNYGGALRPGEGEAMAQFVQTGKRIPRRGEVGLTSDEIEAFENLGYVMSGSRHRRMNAVRIRKENQVYSAEEQRALAMYNYEERANRDAQLISDLKEMLKQQNEVFMNQTMKEKIEFLKEKDTSLTKLSSSVNVDTA